MASDGTIYIPSFMKTDSDIPEILRALPQQFESWYYCWEGFMKYAIEIASGGIIYIQNFMLR
jgi:hypothetical protein